MLENAIVTAPSSAHKRTLRSWDRNRSIGPAYGEPLAGMTNVTDDFGRAALTPPTGRAYAEVP